VAESFFLLSAADQSEVLEIAREADLNLLKWMMGALMATQISPP
jgi:hypothetical protein